jgi:dihydrofolate synthase/folylpolyglutamate synthase
MAFAAFADAPVDVAVVEVGLGGTWDATNVADGPGRGHHADRGGPHPVPRLDDRADRGREGGDPQAGSYGVLAQQPVEAAEVLLRRSVEVDALVAREGLEFGVTSRTMAVGGQLISVRGLAGEYDDLFLPLLGAHQAHNAACASRRSRRSSAGAHAERGPLDLDLVRAGVRRRDLAGAARDGPQLTTVVLDAAHNPAGARATGRGAGGVLRLHPAGRGVRGDG